jgi:hypothetical protein
MKHRIQPIVMTILGALLMFGISIPIQNNRANKLHKIDIANIELAQKIQLQPIEGWSKLLVGQNIGVLDKLGIKKWTNGSDRFENIIYIDNYKYFWIISNTDWSDNMQNAKIIEIHGPLKNMEKTN